MEEIIDLEELENEVTPENLKEFLSKDEETENLLNEKIDELSKEEEKLKSKEEEIKSLEESNREKINTNASPEELIEIAGKIKDAEEELNSIKENIEKLNSEKDEIIKTKDQFESSKKEYIKNLSETSSNYEVQLNKISEAIDVCDNPTLKQVLEDVQAKMNTELNELKEKRLNELKIVLKDEEEIKEEVVDTPVLNMPVSNDLEIQPEVNNTDNNNADNIISIDSILSNSSDVPNFDVNEEIKNQVDIVPNIDNNILDNSLDIGLNISSNPVSNQDDNILGLDSILNTEPKVDLNVVNTDNIIIPEVNQIDVQNENKIKIIYEKDVPNFLLKEIYSSSKIMPSLYDYLNSKNEGSFN